VPYSRRSFAATGCRTPSGCSPRGKAAFKAVCDLDLEGIVAKRLSPTTIKPVGGPLLKRHIFQESALVHRKTSRAHLIRTVSFRQRPPAPTRRTPRRIAKRRNREGRSPGQRAAFSRA
jgi:hypothetical protein